jgi:DNA-binding NtrC family response regulator
VELTRDFGKIGANEIGIIRGEYKDTRQLLRSAHDAINSCARRGRTVVVFVVLPSPLFAEAWEEQVRTASKRTRRASPLTDESLAEHALHTLDRLPVPESLTQAYIGNAPSIHLIHQLILRAASHSCPVLIQGESGTGKEIIARNIHEFSQSHGRGPEFRPINCSAISPFLLESELFGHVKGAFAEAVRDRAGLWRAAGKGTIFLDEIGDLNKDQQAKILRALDSSKVKPVGMDEEVDVHARVISATNRDLYAMIRRGAFREDLFFRLCVIPIQTPPLREHPEDVPVLAAEIWSDLAGEAAPRLSNEILECITEYTWPGNVRELKAVLYSLFIHYGPRAKTRDQFDTVMFLTGRLATAPTKLTARQSATRTRVEYLQHLHHVDKVLRGIEVFLKPLGSARRTAIGGTRQVMDAQTALNERHRELLQLCQQPLLFSSEKVFESVYSVCGKVSYFLESLDPASPGPKPRATRDLAKHVRTARATVARQIETLTPTAHSERS